ncbi:hypothetical protein DFH28DRAFT_948170 [Melampsora americana]|nr:hypothetical protein DFH28DRAFT_948170 [Melampsora americana]
MNPNFNRASTCAPSYPDNLHTSAHTSCQIQNTPSTNPDPNNINSPNCLQAVEDENRKLKEEIESLKSLFHNIAINNPNQTNTPSKTRRPRKSITPQKLKNKTSHTHDLDKVDLDHISKPVLASCYDLARCLMNRETGTSPVPDPPSILERRKLEGFFDISPNPPSDTAGLQIQQRELVSITSNSKIDQDYIDFVHGTMRRWGITRFTMDWERHYNDRFNQIMCQFFLKVWKWGLAFGRFGPLVQNEAAKLEMDELVLMAIYWQHTKSLRRYYKRGKKGEEILTVDQAKNTQRQSLKRKSVVRQLYLQNQGVHLSFIEPFDDKDANSDDELVIQNDSPLALAKVPAWRSQTATNFIDWIEARQRSQRISTTTLWQKKKYGVKATLRPRQRSNPPIIDEKARIPIGLPVEDWYSGDFLSSLSYADKKALEIRPAIFTMIDDFSFILPQMSETFHAHDSEVPHIVTVSKEKKKAWEDESSDYEDEEVNNVTIKLEEDEEMNL